MSVSANGGGAISRLEPKRNSVPIVADLSLDHTYAAH